MCTQIVPSLSFATTNQNYWLFGRQIVDFPFDLSFTWFPCEAWRIASSWAHVPCKDRSLLLAPTDGHEPSFEICLFQTVPGVHVLSFQNPSKFFQRQTVDIESCQFLPFEHLVAVDVLLAEDVPHVRCAHHWLVPACKHDLRSTLSSLSHLLLMPFVDARARLDLIATIRAATMPIEPR